MACLLFSPTFFFAEVRDALRQRASVELLFLLTELPEITVSGWGGSLIRDPKPTTDSFACQTLRGTTGRA